MAELSLNSTRTRLQKLSITSEVSLAEKTPLEKVIKELPSTESLMALLPKEETCVMATEEVAKAQMEEDSQMKTWL